MRFRYELWGISYEVKLNYLNSDLIPHNSYLIPKNKQMDFKKLAKNLLFIDIETVSAEGDFNRLSDRMKALWLHKASFLSNPNKLNDEEFYFDRAGIYAEYGKIVTIGVGFFHWNDEDEICLKVKSKIVRGLNPLKMVLNKHRLH